MKFVQTFMAASMAVAFAGLAQAAVSPEEAAKLGTTLTKMGAEKAGNADGSIPEYTGGLTTAPANYVVGGPRVNPYADEKPIMVIDGKNVAQYKDQLTATIAEMMGRFAGFRVDVYPTHRSAALPAKNLENNLKNALTATTTNGGQGMANALPGVPFPIPNDGSEAMWNHLMRYQGDTISSKYDSWNVDAAGVAILATTGLGFINYPVYEEMDKVMGPKDLYYRIKLYYTGPARRAGEAVLVQDAVDPIAQPRRAWQYLPGQRRVKLAPDLAYDTPNPGSAGANTYDDSFVFSGALDRFDWKLVGKKEMYIPYNTYDLTNNKDPKTMTTVNYLEPGYVRYEKHRVWVVEATLKPGKRHVYHKRNFYLDEDTWIAVASDEYDARGQLYRGSLGFVTQHYDVNVPNATPHMIYDLVGGTYNVTGLTGPYGGAQYLKPLSKAKWSPESLAGAGIR